MLLEIQGVSKRFRTGGKCREVLSQVDLKVAEGEIVALLGASGAGKTTLLHLVAGLLAADAGQAFFAGKPLPLDGTRQGRERMAMVFQDPFASLSPHLTIRATLEEPLRFNRVPRKEWEGRIREALEEVGLTPSTAYLSRYPHQLSGGQRQRVALARALGTRPLLLLADEPTSMLDASVGVEILNLLRRLAQKGTAVLLTAHDVAAASYVADRLVVLGEGKKLEEGPPADLCQNPVIL